MDTSTLVYFGLGFIGAIAPEIVRLYRIRTNPMAKVPGTYWLISLAMCLLGGILTIVIPAVNYWGAFYIGIAAPLIISTATKATPEIKPPATTREISKSQTPLNLSVRDFMGAL